MNYLEIVNAKNKFIHNLKSLSHEDIIEFLNFNRYHHKRPFQEILSLFVQAPLIFGKISLKKHKYSLTKKKS
ncbi:hypothetical protein [Lactococcus sp. DD01]|uniref:hypothetical protein n=1 Tax=Lactococcus sp. DD01 TaxID=1776443 RepID=UPI0007761F5A|nr:hypothetical protein [Lactococcus sp. DD01]